MPKAPTTFAQDDEEEKTTIESGWEDEASTTVEQGEVADKLRSLGGNHGIETPMRGANNTGRSVITSTNGGALEELTVDDQRAHAALSLITPSVAPARIVVTAGNDKGQELEIRPGKIYTIGRAIDNDFVLTDIAVSRKHFELRHENGTWLVADRGSGNGTVVNGNIEDQPYVLMNGDSIEIGNTTFRFDHANQPGRTRNAFADEDEPSTVAGKPLREPELPLPATPPQMLPPLPRPKTQPPPPLPRPRSPSALPTPQGPPGYAGINGVRGSAPPMPSAVPLGAPIQQPPSPATTLRGGGMGGPPMPGLPPTRGPLAPTMLGDANGMVRPQMLAHAAHEGMPPMQNVLPTTIPGQGPPVAPSQPQVAFNSYPNVADMQPHHQLHINGGIPRDATSTALVQPQPYSMQQPAMAHSFGLAQPTPSMSRKVKILIGGAALMVLAAIATIAIIKSAGDGKKKPSANENKGTTVEPIKNEKKTETPIVTPTTDTKTTVDDPKKAEEARKAEELRKAEEAKKAEEQRKAEEAAKKAELKKAEQQKKAEELAAKREEARRKAEEAAKKKAEARDKKKKGKGGSGPTVAVTEPDDEDPPPERKTTVAPAEPKDTTKIKEDAENLYRAKKFNDAASKLRNAASKLGEADARDLRSVAAVYEQVGKAYNIGMGPATPPVEAFQSLERALNLDRPIGIFSDEIKGKLGQVAPRAAVKFMADKNYEAAFKAVRVAEANGGGNDTTKNVRNALVGIANDLYAEAMAEKDSNPGAARAKLQRIKAIVDGKAQVLVKAEQALRSLK